MNSYNFYLHFGLMYWLIALSLFFASLANGQDNLDSFIEKTRASYQVPGVSVVIVKDDNVIFAKGYGFCGVEQKDSVDENTLFQLASVSKTFTSAGLGVLVDKKKLAWDEEILSHLPGCILKDIYATRYSTARDLLAHRTGLPAFRGDLLGKIGLSREEILARVKWMEPGASFREKALYSNVGFFIAGELLAKLSHTSFEKAIQISLLEPLEMKRSGFHDLLEQPNVAKPCALIEGTLQEIPRDRSILFAAAGGVFSTAKDLGNWLIMHLNEGKFKGKAILSPATVQAIQMPSMVGEISFTESAPINANSSYCFSLGWNSYNYNGAYIVEKGGALDGVRAIITLIPEHKLGIAVLANLNLTLLPEVIRAHFLETYLGPYKGDLKAAFAAQEQQVANLLAPPEKPKNPLPMDHPVKDYTGSFSNSLYGTLTIDDHLIVHAGPAKGTLTHWSNNTFLLRWEEIDAGNESVTFTFGEDGNATCLQTKTLGTFTAPKN